MAEVTATDDVPVNADKVWSVIGDFSGIRKWAVLVQAETTEQTPRLPSMKSVSARSGTSTGRPAS